MCKGIGEGDEEEEEEEEEEERVVEPAWAGGSDAPFCVALPATGKVGGGDGTPWQRKKQPGGLVGGNPPIHARVVDVLLGVRILGNHVCSGDVKNTSSPERSEPSRCTGRGAFPHQGAPRPPEIR